MVSDNVKTSTLRWAWQKAIKGSLLSNVLHHLPQPITWGGLSPAAPASFISWERWGHSESPAPFSLLTFLFQSCSWTDKSLCSIQRSALACIHLKTKCAASLSKQRGGGGKKRSCSLIHAFPLSSSPSLSLCDHWLSCRLARLGPSSPRVSCRGFSPSHCWHSDKASSAAAARTQLNYNAWAPVSGTRSSEIRL